jgi:hypothetical protein
VLNQRCGAEARRARRRGGMPAAWMRRSVGRVTGGGEPADMPVVTGLGACARGDLCLPTGDHDSTMGNYLDKNSRSLRRRVNGAPLTRTPPRRSWGRGPSLPGWWRLQARRSTCLLLRALQRRRVESLGALSSSPVHRALVLVLETNM